MSSDHLVNQNNFNSTTKKVMINLSTSNDTNIVMATTSRRQTKNVPDIDISKVSEERSIIIGESHIIGDKL